MARKDSLRLRYVETIASAGLYSLRSEPVETGYLYCIEHTAWEISLATSGGNTRCRLYIEGHGYKHYLAEQVNPVANRLYTWSKNEFLHQGERLVLDIDQAQATTVAQMLLLGYREAIKAGGGEK